MTRVSTQDARHVMPRLPGSTFKAQRANLLKHVEYYVKECGVEQQTVLRNQLPTLQEYRQTRMGTGAVYVLLALTESVSIACCPDKLRGRGSES